jgi:hypothetical protein
MAVDFYHGGCGPNSSGRRVHFAGFFNPQPSSPGHWAAAPRITVDHLKFYEPTHAQANNSDCLESTAIAKSRSIAPIILNVKFGAKADGLGDRCPDSSAKSFRPSPHAKAPERARNHIARGVNPERGLFVLPFALQTRQRLFFRQEIEAGIYGPASAYQMKAVRIVMTVQTEVTSVAWRMNPA